MKIAVIGGSGLIGSAVAAHLTSRGHSVVPMSRGTRGVSVDISKATSPAYWLPQLVGIEAVINCAGVLQDGPADSTSMVHFRSMRAAPDPAGNPFLGHRR